MVKEEARRRSERSTHHHNKSTHSSIQKIITLELDRALISGWDSLIRKRARVIFPNDSARMLQCDLGSHTAGHIRCLNPHSGMCVLKTLLNSWFTSYRMHEGSPLPCIFGCGSDAGNSVLAKWPIETGDATDTTAHYLCCPILLDIIAEASGRWWTPPVADLVCCDKAGTSLDTAVELMYTLYHTIKIGNRALVDKSVSSKSFADLRIFALCIARANFQDVKKM